MKNFKKVLALVLVLATLMGFATVAGAAYKDEKDINADYSEAVQVLNLIETMQGYPDGEFKPTAKITREEAAKLIAIFDNKDSDISTYYTSINPFADEKGRWGESYVGYGYRAGIIAGMNATTYAPTANVTGTQFLKMALVTLGYDQEAEGFVGSSWAVNVLALARKLDLIDGLADGWKAEADLTREEAAQILLNTLKADTVEYAQEAKQVGFKPTVKNGEFTWNGRLYLTVAGAVSTGNKLYKDFDLEKSTSYDAFYRPYVKWTLGKDSVEVMEAPKATFTTRFSACDLLAELGVEKTDKKTKIVIDGIFNDGVPSFSDPLIANADAADGYTLKTDDAFEVRPSGQTHGGYKQDKFIGITAANQFGVWHHTDSTCARATGAKQGAQGTLTQVFYNGKDAEGNKHYYVTSIETWLAKVDSVTTKTTSRDEHLTSDGAVKLKDVYTEETTGVATTWNYAEYRNPENNVWNPTCHDYSLKNRAYDANGKCTLTYDDPTGISKGDYVLLTYSFKSGKVESLDVVEGKEGKLNGYKGDSVTGAKNPTQTRVDADFIKDSVHFSLGYNLSKNDEKFGTYTFFYDAYGNVIGMTDATDTSGWGVFDAAWIELAGKNSTFYGDIVNLDADTAEKSTVKAFDEIYKELFDANTTVQIDEDRSFAYDVAMNLKNCTNGEAADDMDALTDHLYKFSVDAKGKYTVEVPTKEDAQGNKSRKVEHAGSLANNTDAEIKVKNNDPTLYIDDKTNANEDKYITLTSNTQFLVHNMDGTYSAYTGYKSAPSMIAHYVEYVMDSDNKFAEVVYLTNDVYTTDSKFIAFVGKPADDYAEIVDEDGTVYRGLEVYVGAEAKTVYIEEKTMTNFFDAADHFTAGFYQFQYLKVDGNEIVRLVKGPTKNNNAGITAADGSVTLGQFTDKKTGYLATAKDLEFFNGTVVKLEGDNVRYPLADDCKIYAIYKDAVDEEIDAAYIENTYPRTGDDQPAGNMASVADAYDVYVELNSDDQVINLYYVLPADAIAYK